MIDKLENIGFYTLSEDRVKNSSITSRLMRCEILLTKKCNFNCPYCRQVGPKNDVSLEEIKSIIDLCARDKLFAIRFSGGEPTLYPYLIQAVWYAKANGIEKIAISTNGSADIYHYYDLIEAGVNDFSISLDACCSQDHDKMSGTDNTYDTVTNNIKAISKKCYTTVGVVVNEDNLYQINDIVTNASSLGVNDIRIIPSAQFNQILSNAQFIDYDIQLKHPILNYRINSIHSNKPVRGLDDECSRRCYMVLDDLAINDNEHYPCIIYMREGGKPIGKMGPDFRKERSEWTNKHNCRSDPICSKNCLDVCREYNNKRRQIEVAKNRPPPEMTW